MLGSYIEGIVNKRNPKKEKEKQMNLRTFAKPFASAFTQAGKDPNRNRWVVKTQQFPKTTSGNKFSLDIRFDKVVHWPEIDENASHC